MNQGKILFLYLLLVIIVIVILSNNQIQFIKIIV